MSVNQDMDNQAATFTIRGKWSGAAAPHWKLNNLWFAGVTVRGIPFQLVIRSAELADIAEQIKHGELVTVTGSFETQLHYEGKISLNNGNFLLTVENIQQFHERQHNGETRIEIRNS